ncbi:TPA: MATE family efflux transporter, partial [Bacillus pseudomycoides]|nr:MATE family efflux transporter [Bacillus pseudomycoides]
VFAMDIMRFMGTPENIIDMSVHYARILFISMPVLFLYFAYTTFMRGTGDSKTPFYFLIVSTVLNMILLPILIFGWLGMPKLDVYGAAYASVISTIITFVVMLIYLKKKNHPLQLDETVRKYLRMDWELLKLLLRLGIPASINMILVSLSEIAVIAFVNRFGSDATAAYGVVNQVASYVQMPAVSLGITVSIFAAQSIGANQFDRLQKVVRAGIVLNYIIGGVLIALIYMFSREILSLFLTNPDTIEIAHSLVMITLWSYLIFGHAQIIGATMRASGTVLWPTIIGVVSIWLVEVPVAYFLSYHTDLGIEGIWIGYPAAFIVSLILQYAYYKFSWQKKRITRLVS